MGQSLHVKRHLGGAGTHAAGVRDNNFLKIIKTFLKMIKDIDSLFLKFDGDDQNP